MHDKIHILRKYDWRCMILVCPSGPKLSLNLGNFNHLAWSDSSLMTRQSLQGDIQLLILIGKPQIQPTAQCHVTGVTSCQCQLCRLNKKWTSGHPLPFSSSFRWTSATPLRIRARFTRSRCNSFMSVCKLIEAQPQAMVFVISAVGASSIQGYI